jgi:hypothetical protein
MSDVHEALGFARDSEGRAFAPLGLSLAVLRDPVGVARDHAGPAGLARLAPQLLLVTALGGLALGAAVGAPRGALQATFAAVKMPLILLAPLLIAVPAVRSLHGLLGTDTPLPRAMVAGLVGTARAALVALALAPVVYLVSSSVDYHLTVLVLALTLIAAGAPGMRAMAESMAEVPTAGVARLVATVGTVAVFGLVAAQTGWLLRPFVLEPGAEVVFLKPVEGDIFDALGHHASPYKPPLLPDGSRPPLHR